MNIEIRNLTKTFGSFTALNNVSLKIPSGELVALLGPSGSGKTTLLRVIAGLETPDSGSVLYQGEDVTYTSPQARNVGLVFQHYALFGHLNVFENIAFGLKVRGMKGKAVRERVQELLSLIQLENFEKRFPAQLSGGQRQRVALARALAVKPRFLLLDEPFGALDAKVRQELRLWLRRLHKEIQLTSVFVTHDQEEAFEVADQVVITNQGRIEQVGTPEEVHARPANAFVVDFLGNVNVLRGSVRAGRALFGSLEIPYPDYLGEEPRPARAYLRNHEVELRRNPDGASYLPVEVTYVKHTGFSVKLGLSLAPEETALHLALPPEDWSRLGLAVGDQAWLVPRSLSVFLEGPDGEATSRTITVEPSA